MKRVLFFVVPLLVVISGCSDQFNLKEDKIEPVSMEVNSGEYPSSGFLNLSWADIQVLAKSVLVENGIIEDYTGSSSASIPDAAFVVNDKYMLKDVLVTSSMTGVEDRLYQWPEIDFEKYSLVIGHFYTFDTGYGTRQFISKGLSQYTLYLELFIGFGYGGFFDGGINNYFAVLYPKLLDRDIEVKRLNTESEAVFINKN